MFTLVALQVLAGLAANKTLARIGDELFLGQPAVSKALRQAEIGAGVLLVEHQGRRVRLTPAGEMFARSARAILDEMADLERSVEEVRRGNGGPLRLVATNTPGNYVLPGIVGDFLQQYPSAEVRLRVLPPDQVWQALLEDGFDLGLAPQPEAHPGWRVEPLYDDELTLFVAPSSPLARRRDVQWDEVRRETLIGAFAGAYAGEYWGRLARLGKLPGRQLELQAAEGVKRLVEKGVGIGVLMGAAIWREVKQGTLVPLVVHDVPLGEHFCLIYRETPAPLPVVEQFRQFLRQGIQRLQSERATTA